MKNKKNLAKYPEIGYFNKTERVVFDRVYREFRWLPHFVVKNLFAWAKEVSLKGIREVRKMSGYHDEPLHGDRQGQRSIRLSRSYRAIYIENTEGPITLLIVEEITKHGY